MAEASLWVREKSVPGRKVAAVEWNRETRSWERVVDDLGNPVNERVPSFGFVGTPSTVLKPMPGANRRATRFMHMDGHITSSPLISAAASQPDSSSYADYTRAKAKHFGWIEYGHCPLEDHQSDREGFAIQKLVAKENREAAAKNDRCRHWWTGGPIVNSVPCRHWLAELDARRDLRNRDDKAKAQAFKSEAEKQTTAIADLVRTVAERAMPETRTEAVAPAPKGKGG